MELLVVNICLRAESCAMYKTDTLNLTISRSNMNLLNAAGNDRYTWRKQPQCFIVSFWYILILYRNWNSYDLDSLSRYREWNDNPIRYCIQTEISEVSADNVIN